MVWTSGLKDAPCLHPAAGRSPFGIHQTAKTKSDIKMISEATEKGYYDKWQTYVYHLVEIRMKKVSDKDHVVMFHLKPVISSCSGCIPAGVATQNN